MDPLAITVETPRAEASGTVKGLAWKLLYGNHRPSLGPDRWEALVEQVDGPSDVKELALDQGLPLEPFARALLAIDSELGEGDGSRLPGIGEAFASRWATMYQRLTEHLAGRPARLIELAVEEVHPWFFPDAGTAEVVAVDERSATVRVDTPLPSGFVAGWLAGMVETTGAEASVDVVDETRFSVTWSATEHETPSRASLVVQATRAKMLPATLAPVLVGTALAAWQGSFDAIIAAVALTGALALHLAFNLLNDVLDHRRGVDEANLTPTPFSGGSRVIQRGLMGSDAMLALATSLGVLGAGLGVVAALEAGGWILALGAAGMALGYAYSGEPFRLADRGLGEVTAALVFGPLLTAGGFAVQTGTVTLPALAAGLPVGVFMGAFLMVNELPDAPWDARTGRRTLAVRLGELAPWGAGLALVVPYPVLAGLAIAGTVPIESLVALATLPFALLVGHRVRLAGTDAEAIARLQGPTLLLHATTGLLMAAGIALGGTL